MLKTMFVSIVAIHAMSGAMFELANATEGESPSTSSGG